MSEPLPLLCRDLVPPVVQGVAALTHQAFAGVPIAALLQAIDRRTDGLAAARALDRATLHLLAHDRAAGLALQAQALDQCRLFRVAGAWAGVGADDPAAPPLRLLAIMQPGDLMANAPLDFITRTLDVRLDLLFLRKGEPLPAMIPDHDVAYVGGGDLRTPAMLARRCALFARWPRPVLNDPARISRLDRASLARILADVPGLCAPPCRAVPRDALAAGLDGGLEDGPTPAQPLLIRPLGSHAGTDLARIASGDQLAAYLRTTDAPAFHLTQYVDYRDPDGAFRKYRIAFIDRAPYLCHMAVSDHWMVHYLNAGMTGCAAKRGEEARAMDGFDRGFATRHRAAFAALNDRIGLDYYTIDCGQTPDGRLLVFEADAEAIVHAMDPPALFAYKLPQMQRVFAAFEAMLRRRARQPALAAA